MNISFDEPSRSRMTCIMYTTCRKSRHTNFSEDHLLFAISWRTNAQTKLEWRISISLSGRLVSLVVESLATSQRGNKIRPSALDVNSSTKSLLPGGKNQ